MIIKYTPFSESISLDKEIRQLEFAEDIIKPYFLMSLRYHDSYYKDQPEGNTIYFINFDACSLLFYFSAGARSHRINGFRIAAAERKKAWLFMLSLIQSLRNYAFNQEGGQTVFDNDFLENTADLEDAMIDVLAPFHFIVSSMPDHCFPKCEEMRLFNRHHLSEAAKSFYYVTRNQIRQTTIDLQDYDLLSEIFWVPASKSSKKWHFEYYTGIMSGEGRNKGKYRVIRRETELPGGSGCCNYSALRAEILQLARENL